MTDSNLAGVTEAGQLYRKGQEPLYLRSYEEVLRLFDGFELVEPGLVSSAFWRPSRPSDTSDDPGINSISYGGVGRKL